MHSPDKDASGEIEVDKHSSALPRYALRSSSLRSAGTGYIPHIGGREGAREGN